MRPMLLVAVLAACGAPSSPKGRDDTTPAGTTTTGVAAGSPTDSATTPSNASPYALEVGGGSVFHEPLAPGATVTIHHGPQGGWHVVVSGRVEGLGPIVAVDLWADRTDSGARVATNDLTTFLQLADHDPAAGTGWFAGEYNLVDAVDLAGVCPLDGVALALCAHAYDYAAPERYAEGCVEVVAALDPDDVAPCAALGTQPP